MDTYDALHSRRTVHNYEATELDYEVVERILSAGHMAPNHKLTWPWRFTVVGKETRKALLPVAYRLKNVTAPEMQARVQSKLINPATLIVVTQERAEDPFRNTEDYAATCCAIQNMMLAATAEGLGSKWSTGALTKHPDVCDILDIDIEVEDVVGFIWVGVPMKVPTIERPALETHVKVLR